MSQNRANANSLARASDSVEPRNLATVLCLLLSLVSAPGVAAEDFLPEQVTPLEYEQARELMRERKWAEAAILLKSIHKREPAFQDAAIDLAGALTYLGRREEAMSVMDDTLQRAEPSEREGLKRRARVLARQFLTSEAFQKHQEGVDLLKADKTAEAKARFEEALSKEPHNVEVLLHLAQALITDGSYDLASEYLRTAKRLDPHSAEIRLWLGRALSRLGLLDESVGELRAAALGLEDSELAPLWLAEGLVAQAKRDEAVTVLDKDARKHPLHLLSLVMSAELTFKKRSSEQGDRSAWDARKSLQLALSRIEQYIDPARPPFKSDLGYSPYQRRDVRAEIEARLKEVDRAIRETEGSAE